ncbi:MAG: Acyl-CoA dehydrogenase [Syntrophorhabdus sp. PtaU1.Bin058]|nr:MAG: Acyl-CoA dehydrogenase [Syntrophorhabdus sp. PtaU1.Bin058]
MDFELNKEETMFRDMAKEFGQKEVLPTVQEREREEKIPFEILKKLSSLGLTGLRIPPEYGGLGQTWSILGLVAEQLAYFDFCVAMALFGQISLVATPILKWGDEAQKKEYVPAVARGEKMGAHAVVEPNVGSDASSIETKAEKKGDGWVLNGNKTWITNATIADFVIVVAQTDKSKGTKGLAAFIIDRDTPGLSSTKIKHKLGLHTQDTGQLFFRDCFVPDSKRLGPVGDGIRVSFSGIEHTRFGLAITSVGVIQACIDACVKYSQERFQFGKPIGSFQLIQERIADMVVDCQAGRYLAYRVASLKDKGMPYSLETSIAKMFCTEAAVRAARQGIEIHGAYGYSDDFPVERYYRDMISNLLMGGTVNIQKLIIGGAVTGLRAIS